MSCRVHSLTYSLLSPYGETMEIGLLGEGRGINKMTDYKSAWHKFASKLISLTEKLVIVARQSEAL